MSVPEQRGKTQTSSYAAPKPTVQQMIASQNEFNRAGTDFLKVDVTTGLTFSQTALSTDDPAKKKRNQRAARKAYDTIAKLIKKVTLSAADAEELKQNLTRLKSDLVALGENF